MPNENAIIPFSSPLLKVRDLKSGGKSAGFIAKLVWGKANPPTQKSQIADDGGWKPSALKLAHDAYRESTSSSMDGAISGGIAEHKLHAVHARVNEDGTAMTVRFVTDLNVTQETPNARLKRRNAELLAENNALKASNPAPTPA